MRRNGAKTGQDPKPGQGTEPKAGAADPKTGKEADKPTPTAGAESKPDPDKAK